MTIWIIEVLNDIMSSTHCCFIKMRDNIKNLHSSLKYIRGQKVNMKVQAAMKFENLKILPENSGVT